jgi:alpha-glucoside transport system permease protein
MVVLSAALKSVPEETLEAARIDGANEFQTFFRVMVPQMASTIVVVVTTILITTLKVFDIVLVMTDGQFDTEVLGNYMFRWMFRGFDDGKASVIAITIMLATLPFLYWNLQRFRKEELYR